MYVLIIIAFEGFLFFKDLTHNFCLHFIQHFYHIYGNFKRYGLKWLNLRIYKYMHTYMCVCMHIFTDSNN